MELKAGYKITEVGLIPDDWEVKELGQIGDVKMCRRIFNEETTSNGEIPFYKIGTFGRGADAYISRALYSAYRERFSFPNKGDILISAAGTIGRTIIYDGGDAYFQDSNIVWIENEKSIISNDYLYHILQGAKYNTEGGTIQRLYNSILKATKFVCPTKSEQTAIATALSDADALITSLEKLIEKKRAIKQGAMQQLLKPKAGWIEFSILQLADNKKELFDDGDWIESEHIKEDGIRLIQTGNIGIGNFVGKASRKYIHESSFIKLRCKELRIGDLLICRLAEPAGRACIFPDIGEYKVITSVDVTIFRPREELVNRVFLTNIFSTKSWFETISGLSGGTTHKRISRGALGRVKIFIPTIDEQNRIASILSEMDKEIITIEQNLFKYQLIKQGMMQELLTGKIRLV